MLYQGPADGRHHRTTQAALATPDSPLLVRPGARRLSSAARLPEEPPAVPHIVILLGMSETGLGAMRLLGARGARCWGVDAALDLPGFRSRYCRRRIHVPTGLEAVELTTILHHSLRGTNERPVLLPTGDRFVKLLSDARDALRDRFDMALPPPDVVDDLLDKQRFAGLAGLAARAGLRVPRSVPAPDVDAVPEAARAVGYPVVVKPRRPMDKEHSKLDKAIVLRTGAEARALVAGASRSGRPHGLVVQEYIPGGDDHHVSVALALDARSRTLVTFTSRKRRQGNRGAGVGTFVESHTDVEATLAARRLLEHIGYVGVAEMELKRHAATGDLFAIEVNARLWSQLTLPAALGVDFALAACHIATGAAHAPSIASPPAPCAWQDLWSDFYWTFRKDGYFRRGELTFLDWLRQTAATRAHPYFSWDDPAPAVLRAWDGFSRVAGRERSRR